MGRVIMIKLPCYPLVPVAYIAILCISIMMNTIAIAKRIISHCIIAIAICNGYSQITGHNRILD